MRAYGTLSGVGVLALAAAIAHAGPDILVSQIQGANNYGVEGAYQAYSFGDSTCNIGDAPFTYIANTGRHPVFATTLYRLQGGRFEQIGLGFVGHTFLPLQSNACNLGCSPGSPGMLGGGCSDTLSAGTAGNQSNLGPRIEIDAHTGEFPYPFTTINEGGDAVSKRLKVNTADISDPSALYFVETQYISVEEQTDAARNNNASYRGVLFSPDANSPVLLGETSAGRAAIYAWRAADPVVMISEARIPGDGAVQVGSSATQLDDGTWRYDYAVHNQNAARGIASLRVFTGVENDPRSIGFHDVEYLDAPDSLIDGADWGVVDGSDFLVWQRGFGGDGGLDNLIRWGTTYSFSFIVHAPPTTGLVRLGVAEAGGGAGEESITAEAIIPSGTAASCPADLTGDGQLDFFDVSAFLIALGAENPAADFNGDTRFDFFDVSAFLSGFAAGCP